MNVQRLQWTESSGQPGTRHLIDPLGPRAIAETMVAEVDHADPNGGSVDDKIARRLRHQDLTAMRDLSQPPRSYDRLSGVAAVRSDPRLTSVDSHPNLHRHRDRPILRCQRA